MKTKLLNINSINLDNENVKIAADILAKGGLVAIPTETVYGLAANAYNGTAVAGIFAAKGRPQDNPLIVHISNFDMIHDLVADLPETAVKLKNLFWPGPLTIILPKSDKIPTQVSAGLDTVAIRMPEDVVARAIIDACGLPLAAPSANRSGSPSPTTAAHVIADLDGRIDAIVVSHDSMVGVESTVISLCVDRPRLLRPGAVTVEQIESAIGKIDIDPAVLSKLESGVKAASPGMKYKHYAPLAKVVLIEANSKQYVSYVNEHKGEGVYSLCFEEDVAELSVPTVIYGSVANEKTQARDLFISLRKLDELGAKVAYAHAPSKDGVGLAVYNRLVRAAAFEVIKL
jgi:L-threonylcarbamoyladenylate synthase